MPFADQIEVATLDDFEAIRNLVDKANQYSYEQSGHKMWTVMDYVYESIKRQLAAGELYKLKNTSDEIIATIAISYKTRLWHEKKRDGLALYVSKLMRDPTATEPGVGLRLLGFAAEKAIVEGKKYLRCDTISALTGLVNYYLSIGFIDKGEFVYHFSDKPGILLQAEAIKIPQAVRQTT